MEHTTVCSLSSFSRLYFLPIAADYLDTVYLGGGYHGQRLNKLFRSSIKEEEILEILKPLFKRYALEREDGEKFGDFCIRIGMIKPTTEGKTFHDDVSPPISLFVRLDDKLMQINR